jgi:hypothetical protein
MPRWRTYTHHQLVKDQLYDDYIARCKVAFAKHDLEPDYKGEAIPLFGTRALDDATTVKSYLSKLRPFVQFILDVGKYDDSLLIFHPHCPKGTIAVQKEALADFMYVPFSPIHSEVVNDMRGNPILNAGGCPITHKHDYGFWHASDNLNQLCSALSHVHRNAHGFGPSYGDQCEQCYEVYKQHGVGGCVHHSPPMYTRRGDVTMTALVRDTMIYIRNNSTHTVSGACHLLPSDVRDLRAYAVATNDIWIMEVYTLLLLSIDLFLRKSEYSSISSENFNTKLFLLTDHFVIEALNVSVKGKRTQTKERRSLRDKYARWRKLWIHGDNRCPDVDTKRHLLAFLYAIKWKGGCLFPSIKELKDPPADGVYKTFMREEDLINTLRSLFTTVIKRNDKLTSHSGRKTGYLWGRLRGASIEQNMQAADHKVFETAKKYMKDAEAIATIIKKVNDPKERLGEWSSCYCANGEETGMRATAPMAKYQVDLKELVVGFIEERVGVPPRHPRCREPKFLLEAIVGWRKPLCAYSELDSHLRDISSDKTSAVLSCVHSIEAAAFKRAKAQFDKEVKEEGDMMCKERLAEFEGYLSHQSSTADATVDKSVDDLFASFMTEKGFREGIKKRETGWDGPDLPKRRKEERGQKVIEGRRSFQWMSMVDRLEFLDKVYDEDHSAYANADRQFLIRAQKAIMCYRKCCDKDFDAFMEKHGVPSKKKNSPLIFRPNEIKECETCEKRREAHACSEVVCI